VIRQNTGLGRPGNVQSIFNRRIIERTPSRFRTRVVTQGVVPSLRIDYKGSTIKRYFKGGRGLVGRDKQTVPAVGLQSPQRT